MQQMRVCLPCRVKFHSGDDKGCPCCGASSFFTMRAGDIGTAMWMEQTGLTIQDLKLVDADDSTGEGK